MENRGGFKPGYIPSEAGENRNVLTPEYGVKLLFYSFYHSQGSRELQDLIFHYYRIIRREYKIDQQMNSEIVRRAYPIFRNYIEGRPHTNPRYHQYISNDGIKEELQMTLNSMSEEFKKKPYKKRSLMRELYRYILDRDIRNLKESNGRPRFNRPNSQPDSFFDPWKSFFKKYVIDGDKAEIPEIREMYKDLREYFEKRLIKRTIKIIPRLINNKKYRYTDDSSRLYLLSRLWEDKHPGSQFLPDDFIGSNDQIDS